MYSNPIGNRALSSRVICLDVTLYNILQVKPVLESCNQLIIDYDAPSHPFQQMINCSNTPLLLLFFNL